VGQFLNGVPHGKGL